MESDENWDGRCEPVSTFETSDNHPTLLGPDGEPLRIMRPYSPGFKVHRNVSKQQGRAE